MGAMRFLVHTPTPPEKLPDLSRAYISGADGRVFPTQVEIEGNVLTCRRPLSESGRLHVAWRIAGFGAPVVCTASLPERDEAYLLALELARGKLAQLRDQISAWELAGMSIPSGFQQPFKEAHAAFRRAAAVQEQPAVAGPMADEALRWAFEAAEIAVQSYGTQRLAARRKRSTQLPAALGCSLGQWLPEGELAESFVEAFTAASVPVEWKHVEAVEGECRWELSDAQVDWCLANRLMLCGGPLLDFSGGGLPKWLNTWEHDLANLQSVVCDYVETAAARYAGKIRTWDVCARANTGGVLGLSEENRLSLVARALDVVRQLDDEVQIQIRIDQPWGGYQSRGVQRLSPLQFVDALLRAGIGLSAVNLEFAVGFRPRGSARRDLLEFSRLLDLWSALGVPLYVTLACPSEDSSPDPHAVASIHADKEGWNEEWSESSQAAWIDSVFPVLMAKQAIVGIFWSHFSDQVPHEFPHAGLVRGDGSPKPALQHLGAQRRTSWKIDSDPSEPLL